MQKNRKLAETPPQSLFKFLLALTGFVGVFCFFTVVAENPAEFVVEACDYEEAVETPDRAEVKKLRIHRPKEEIDLSIFSNLTELHISFCEDFESIKKGLPYKDRARFLLVRRRMDNLSISADLE